MNVSKIGIKLVLFVLISTLFISVGATPAANAASKQQYVTVNKADFHFIVDGKVYHAPQDTQGFLYKNRVYVPIRFASYLLEKWVVWNNNSATVSIKMPSATQLKQLKGYKEQYSAIKADTTKAASGWKKEKIYTAVDVAKYNFFGKDAVIPQDVTTFLHKGTIYVPLRFFAESIQHDITYNSATKSVIMKTRSNTDVTNPEGSNSDAEVDQQVEQALPTREEIVAATEAELRQLKSKLITKAYALAAKYVEATSEEQQKYKAEGKQELAKADAEVSAIIEKMNKELQKYNYELGNEGEKFLETYEAEKDAMLGSFLNS